MIYMNIKDLLEFVKTHNLPLDTELGFITDERLLGSGFQFTILVNQLTGKKTVCLDEDYDFNK